MLFRSWVDNNGKLHENVRINSDMKVRGVRVLNYLQAEDGPSAAIIAEGKGVMPGEEVCKANLQRYRREATFDTSLHIATSGADRHGWTMLLRQAKGKLLARATAGRKWALSPVTKVPANDYDRLLSGVREDITPYHMQLELLPPGALGTTISTFFCGVQPWAWATGAAHSSARTINGWRRRIMRCPSKQIGRAHV